MIYKTGTRTPITGAYGKDSNGVVRTITAIYNGAGRVIWQAIRSCYGAGYWINTKPWLNDEGWRNE